MNVKLLETIAIANFLGLAIAGCSSKTGTAQTETHTPMTTFVK